MLNIKSWLADLLGVLTPQTKTTGVFQARQQFTINPALTPDHAPDGCMANPGTTGEIVHGINHSHPFQRFQHVFDVPCDLNGASKHGVIDFDLTKSRPLATPREIAGAGNWGASGHAHQSKAVAA